MTANVIDKIWGVIPMAPRKISGDCNGVRWEGIEIPAVISPTSTPRDRIAVVSEDFKNHGACPVYVEGVENAAEAVEVFIRAAGEGRRSFCPIVVRWMSVGDVEQMDVAEVAFGHSFVKANGPDVMWDKRIRG
jgi:hypothetical protein